MTHQPDTDPDWSPSGGDDAEERTLRARYLDYCSARISEVFLALSDDRIYDLMEEAAREAGLEPGKLGYRARVKLVTEKLRESVPLPDLDEWAREYREHPERFEPFLLGLGESPVERVCGPGEDPGDGSGDAE